MVFFCDTECAKAASITHYLECEAIKHFSRDSTVFEYDSEDDIASDMGSQSMMRPAQGSFAEGLGRQLLGKLNTTDIVDEETGFLVLMIFCRALCEQTFPSKLGMDTSVSRGVYYKWCFDDMTDLVRTIMRSIVDGTLRPRVTLPFFRSSTAIQQGIHL